MKVIQKLNIHTLKVVKVLEKVWSTKDKLSKIYFTFNSILKIKQISAKTFDENIYISKNHTGYDRGFRTSYPVEKG